MLCLVLSLTGCSSKDEKWQQAYSDWFSNHGNETGYVMLYDINFDNVPEMLYFECLSPYDSDNSWQNVDDLSNCHEGNFYIVSYRKGDLIEYNKYLGLMNNRDEEHGAILWQYNDKKTLALAYGQYNSDGDFYKVVQVIKMKKKSFEDKSVYIGDYDYIDDRGNYSIDGVSVDHDKFDKELSLKRGYGKLDHGIRFDRDVTCLYDAIKYYEDNNRGETYGKMYLDQVMNSQPLIKK